MKLTKFPLIHCFKLPSLSIPHPVLDGDHTPGQERAPLLLPGTGVPPVWNWGSPLSTTGVPPPPPGTEIMGPVEVLWDEDGVPAERT